MVKDVTLADIAAEVGVSVVAVSKALSGKPGVSDELRYRVKMVAERMGYVPTKSSRSKTGNIGVIIPEHYYGYSVSFYRQLHEYVVKALYEQKYFGILELLSKRDEIQGKIPMILQEGKVDGVIVLGQMNTSYMQKIEEEAKVPVCFLDTYIASSEVDAVVSDGFHGTYLLTKYLIQNGYQKIAFIGNVEATSSIADRFWGYRKALREHGITFLPEWEISDKHESGSNFEFEISSCDVMEAYVCNSDYAAHRLLQKLEAVGISVPEDVAVVGFDDYLPVGMEENRITTYSVDMERMAKVCVESLERKIKGKKYSKGIQVVNGRMIERATVKKKIV